MKCIGYTNETMFSNIVLNIYLYFQLKLGHRIIIQYYAQNENVQI